MELIAALTLIENEGRASERAKEAPMAGKMRGAKPFFKQG